MQLSEDQKQQILEEESKRLAEEYRAEVRRELRSQAGAGDAVTGPSPETAQREVVSRKSRKHFLLLIIPAVVAILWIARKALGL